MGTFYTVDAEFWTDPEVVDNLTPEDRYFYLYLLTNPHGNCSGCFQISIKQIADELGYSRETVERLIERFVSVHKMIDYDATNKEILIHKWGKRHWTKSDKYMSAVQKKIDAIKTKRFRDYLSFVLDAFTESEDMVWIGYQYGMDTSLCPMSYIQYPITDNQYPIEDKGREEEKEKREEERKSSVGNQLATTRQPKEESPIQVLVEAWNNSGFRRIERMSPSSTRYKMANRRIEEYGIDKVLEALYRADKSDFLHGKSDRGWEMDFDWFVKPSNFQKVLEGNYDNRGKKNKTFLDMYKELKDEEDGSCATIVSY